MGLWKASLERAEAVQTTEDGSANNREELHIPLDGGAAGGVGEAALRSTKHLLALGIFAFSAALLFFVVLESRRGEAQGRKLNSFIPVDAPGVPSFASALELIGSKDEGGYDSEAAAAVIGRSSSSAKLYAAGLSNGGRFGGIPKDDDDDDAHDDVLTPRIVGGYDWAEDDLRKYYDRPIRVDLSDAPFDASQIKDVAAGAAHTLVVLRDGTAWSSGDNFRSQLCLGNNFRDDRPTFARVPGLSDVTEVVAGPAASVFILGNGTAMGCGFNGYGGLGIGGTDGEDVTVPTVIGRDVTGFDGHVVHAAAGQFHTVFVTRKGEAYSSGGNKHGQLGVGDRVDRSVPAPVKGMKNRQIKQAAAGMAHTAFLDTEGVLYTTGLGRNGQLGHGNEDDDLDTPRQVDGVSSVQSVQCAKESTYILRDDNSLFSAGSNDDGVLGLGSSSAPTSRQSSFRHVRDGVTTVACGSAVSNACFFVATDEVEQDGKSSLWGFGDGSAGQLGLGDAASKAAPARIDDLSGDGRIDGIALGLEYTLFLHRQVDVPSASSSHPSGPSPGNKGARKEVSRR